MTTETETQTTTISDAPCDDEGQCSRHCQCNQVSVRCDFTCSDEGDVCQHIRE